MDPEFVAQAKRRKMQVAAIQRSQSSIFAAGMAAGAASASSQPAPSSRGASGGPQGKGRAVRRAMSTEEATRAREEKERQKAEEKARKEAEKERKRLEREEAKRQKELEKEQRKKFNDANKVQSKDTYSSELHAYIHLFLTTRMVDFDEIIRGLSGVGTKSTIVGPASPIAALPHAPPPECITFTRSTYREFNADRQVWEPTDHAIVTRIPLIVMLIDGFSLGDRVLADPLEVPRELNKACKRGRLYLLVENLDGWMKRKQTASNRARNAAGMGAAPSEHVPEWQRVLDTVNEWRLVHQFTVILTRNRNETVSYMNVIAREVGAMPYRKLAHSDESLCADISVASGKSNADTWRLMLEAVKGVTEPISRAIVSHYPTMESLYKAYRRDPGRAPGLLATIQVVRDPTGNGKSRNIGPAMSGKIHSILMGTDPSFVL
ncbi:hypothetical protein BCR44DRAFT_1429513 [Catenaria anguillulae PL171]|uniref:Uncharacterized protein n=1 Tax=Catenaria anguillulae PL171 TaxID=765915 RepID=A0A1Y2HTY7_9FUNG|nr:hypothetical protein BCR44DRAFT_1429513 [Catenaria anguillulae PL171]